MNKLLLILLLIFTFSCAKEEKKWQLVWNDEFDNAGLPDSKKWTAETGGHGWGNNELQFYTEGRMENARVENGKLIIEARKEDWQGSKYTSARLISKNKGDWQYGKIEVKAKLPKGRGSWPAIWMLASTNPLKWPDDGEIDIMEHVGFDQGIVHASVHTKKFNHVIGTQKTNKITVTDCSENFHIYSAEWNKDSVKIAVDGNYFFQFANDKSGYEAWPFDNKMHLLLNVAVGGNWGGQQGIDDSIWPLQMEIDYVRMYRQ